MATSVRHARIVALSLAAIAALAPVELAAQGRTVSGVVRDCYIKHGVEAVRVGLEGKEAFVLTDSAGRFTIPGTPRTAFVLTARRVGYIAQQFEVFAGNDTTVRITLRPNLGGPASTRCELTLDAQVTRVLNGYVRDAVTNQGVQRAQVTVQGTSLGTFADSSGAFTIVGVLRDSLVLTAKRIGYQSVNKFLPAGGDTTVTFYLQTSATLRPVRRDTLTPLRQSPLRPHESITPCSRPRWLATLPRARAAAAFPCLRSPS